MTTYSRAQAENQARMPPDAVTVSPRAFLAEWEDRPNEDVCMGLRTLATSDMEDARLAAADAATRLYPRASEGEPFFSLWADHYNDMLVRSIVARGTCDPNDATQPWEGWRNDPDDLARTYLTTEGVQLLFDAWERMRIAHDVTGAPATDEEIDSLIARIGDVTRLPRLRALRVRRLLAFCLTELQTLDA